MKVPEEAEVEEVVAMGVVAQERVETVVRAEPAGGPWVTARVWQEEAVEKGRREARVEVDEEEEWPEMDTWVEVALAEGERAVEVKGQEEMG